MIFGVASGAHISQGVRVARPETIRTVEVVEWLWSVFCDTCDGRVIRESAISQDVVASGI